MPSFSMIRISLSLAGLYYKTAIQLSPRLVKAGNKENCIEKQKLCCPVEIIMKGKSQDMI